MFSKVGGFCRGTKILGLQEQFMLEWYLKGATMAGKNIALNDEINYRGGKGKARSSITGKLRLLMRAHPFFNSFGIAPFSYMQGWLSNEKAMSFRNLRKEAEFGVGFYVTPLHLNVEFGLLDIEGTNVRPSSRFRVGIDI